MTNGLARKDEKSFCLMMCLLLTGIKAIDMPPLTTRSRRASLRLAELLRYPMSTTRHRCHTAELSVALSTVANRFRHQDAERALARALALRAPPGSRTYSI